MRIGIDIGGTNVKIGLVDDRGQIVQKDSFSTDACENYEQFVQEIVDQCQRLIAAAGYEMAAIRSAGAGCPGAVNDQNGTLIYMPNIEYRNVPLGPDLSRQFGCPVYLGNDANCAALAESAVGAARDADHSITITLGTGIGGGIVINNEIYTGFNHIAGELGHIVLTVDGWQCGCGRKGCFEAYASVTGLIRMTREAMAEHPDSLVNRLAQGDPEKVSGKTAFKAAQSGDAMGLAIVNRYIGYLAEGVANLINVFQPEVFVIGGGISKEGDYLLDPLKKLLASRVYQADVPRTKIKVAETGNDAGIIGAAMLGGLSHPAPCASCG